MAATIYQPWNAVALPILDFAEFLPRLVKEESPASQIASIAEYMRTQGRFCPLLYAYIVAAWNAFGMWAPGWHWTYFSINAIVLVSGRRLLLDMGCSRFAVFASLGIWIVTPAVASGWLRPTGEPLGLIFAITAMRLAYGFQDASDWRRRAVLIALSAAAMISAKEMLVVLLPAIWAMTRLSHRDGIWRIEAWARRDTFAVATTSVATILSLVPVAIVALVAPRNSYAARYGTKQIDLTSILSRLETALLPSRTGMPSIVELRNDLWWQTWLTLPNLLWIALIAIGVASAARMNLAGRLRWPVAIGAIWVLSGVAAYLPWPSQASFYMLPFAFGGAFAFSHLLSPAFSASSFRVVAAAAAIAITSIGAVEARDMRSEHDLKVRSDANVISEVAQRGKRTPLVAAVPDPAPPGAFGWGRMLADYGRAAGRIDPASSRDVSCDEGRDLIARQAAVTVVTADKGCGMLSQSAAIVSESVPRRRWPALFDKRVNRRIAFVMGS